MSDTMKCACGRYEIPSPLLPGQLRDGVYHMAPQMTPEGKPLLCEIVALRSRAERAEAQAERLAGAVAALVRDAEWHDRGLAPAAMDGRRALSEYQESRQMSVEGTRKLPANSREGR